MWSRRLGSASQRWYREKGEVFVADLRLRKRSLDGAWFASTTLSAGDPVSPVVGVTCFDSTARGWLVVASPSPRSSGVGFTAAWYQPATRRRSEVSIAIGR